METVGDIDFFKDIVEMGLDCMGADVKFFGNHLVRRPLHNPHFCSILVIARSKATWQSCGLSTGCEIASLRSQ